MTTAEFIEFPKLSRFAREVIVTEKIDGTNAQVFVDTATGVVMAGSRTRWVTPEVDNHGFAKWVQANRDELLKLGDGRHFGEWWGSGIQRGYGLAEKRFSLFNTERWGDAATRPACCHVVPVLWRGHFDFLDSQHLLKELQSSGSVAAPGFMKPEGIVIFHPKGNVGFKRTIEKDDEPKSMASAGAR